MTNLQYCLYYVELFFSAFEQNLGDFCSSDFFSESKGIVGFLNQMYLDQAAF